MITNFEIGEKVRVVTPYGIVDGEITVNYRNTNTNQFTVSFNHINSGYSLITLSFSKKTGKLYNPSSDLKNKYSIV